MDLLERWIIYILHPPNMRTIEDLNKLLENYPLYYSVKLFWRHWKYKDFNILRFEYKYHSLCVVCSWDSELFMSWDLQNCIDKTYDEIIEKKSINNHCLFADPL